MQLKGLIRFFTILLIIYSIYELSFTWVVRSHENKMAAKAKQWVRINLPNASKASQDSAYDARYKRLLDSTKDETVSYGITGAISYDKAKREELNLGLDLKGGMNVSMEVELSGMLRSMSNYSKDPNFLKALDNATARKANTGANYIDLFADEYHKLNPNGRLASLFLSNPNIKINDSDASVVSALKKASGDAFDNTFRVIQTRIDKFGVAQPNINKDRDRNVITVELPGIQDPERVRKYLQSSANLEFWPVYKDWQIMPYFVAADNTYNNLYGNHSATPASDTSKKAGDTSAVAKTDTSKTAVDTSTNRKSIAEYLNFSQPIGGGIASLSIRDTGIVMQFLNNPAIRRNFPGDAKFVFGVQPLDKNNKRLPVLPLYVLRTEGKDKAPIDGSVITTADPSFDQLTNSPTVTMDMNATGSRLWEQMTDRSYKDTMPIAITLDDVVYSAPIAHKGKITGGRTEISGSFTVEEANDLASILKAGRLPAPAKIVAEQQVGPTLGAEAINGGFKAFIFSFIVIFTLMLVYYNSAGWIANIALILNLLFTIGVLTGLGATLTAPGIAGLVLTIGMAVDTNVIIYERIKEELTKGKGYIPAVNEGYKRSLPPVLDAHVTTLLTAIILFSFGLGPVKGFATTQIIGILLSLFCGILVSRWVTEWFTDKKRHMEYFTPISKRIFKHANFKFIEYRKIAYGISAVVLILGVASIFHGFNEGVEFKGGRSYTVKFDQPVNGKVEDIRKDLAAIFGEAPIIKTVGGNKQLNITTTYKIGSSGTNIDNEIESTLMGGLKKYLPANISFEQFDKDYKTGYVKVEPTISEKLKNDAKWATFWSLLIIALYIFVRFRDWRYSLGTIIALLHDVLVTLAVFSFLKDVVPFPLELDQHFIAAVLTVIGFSMNDTVIVFDRIREYSRQMVGAPKEKIINEAVNHTLSRTIMTSLTVFLTILILFLVGGEVTRGFAFAMLIGVITGTYSSVFVAAPILVDLGGKKALGSETAAEKRAAAAAEKKAALSKPKHA